MGTNNNIDLTVGQFRKRFFPFFGTSEAINIIDRNAEGLQATMKSLGMLQC